MTLKPPEGFGKEYWSKSFEERFENWADFLASRLDITKGEAEEKILGVRTLPLIDTNEKASPRFEAAARLLYEASPICPNHKRRHGATLASESLIFKLSGASCLNKEKRWNEFLKLSGEGGLIPHIGMGELLVKQRLSESNPYNNNNSMEMFSYYDIMRGIRLPKTTDKSAIRCVGYTYGRGQLKTKCNSLFFIGRKFDLGLQLAIQLDFDQAFNLWEKVKIENLLIEKQKKNGLLGRILGNKKKKRECTIRGEYFEFGDYSRPVLIYNSKAICGWFVDFGVSTKRPSKRLPPKLFDLSNDLKREFTRALISSGSYFHSYNGTLILSDTSEKFLKDCEALFTDVGIDCSSPSKKSYGEGHYLSITRDSTIHLREQGGCPLNPYLQSRMDKFYGQSSLIED